MSPELLAALVADKGLGSLARGDGGAGLLAAFASGSSRLSLAGLQFLQRLVLVLLEPVQGLLYCIQRQHP